MDISHQRSRGVKEFLGRGVPYLITVCDQANERCPIFPGAVNRLHWSFEDPAAAKGPDEERICVSRRVRDEIEAAVRRFAKEIEEHRPLTGAISSTKAPAAA